MREFSEITSCHFNSSVIRHRSELMPAWRKGYNEGDRVSAYILALLRSQAHMCSNSNRTASALHPVCNSLLPSCTLFASCLHPVCILSASNCSQLASLLHGTYPTAFGQHDGHAQCVKNVRVFWSLTGPKPRYTSRTSRGLFSTCPNSGGLPMRSRVTASSTLNFCHNRRARRRYKENRNL